MKHWAVIFTTCVIFVSGATTGGILVKTYPRWFGMVRQPEGAAPYVWQIQRAEFLRRMNKHLDLSSSQRDNIERIMKESQDRTRPLWELIGPELRDELSSVREQIRGELKADQAEKFDQMLNVKKPLLDTGKDPVLPGKRKP